MATGPIRQPRRRPTYRRGILALTVAVLLLAAAAGYLWHSTHSWSWYTDSHFPFRVEVPPAWQAGWWENTGNLGDCSHDVDMLPPGSIFSPGREAETLDPEIISIVVNINCPAFGAAANPLQFQNPRPLTISGMAATLYESTSDPGNSLADVVFGGHDYNFDLTAPSNRLQQDMDLYLQVMRSFQYSGPS